MTKPKKSKAPVSSFGPELQSALRSGSNKRLELSFESPALAVRFAARINQLRSAMRAEGHPDADRLYRAGVYLPKGTCTVVIMPKDSEFRDALKAAGVDNVPEPPTVVRHEISTPRPGVVADPANDFLASLTEATTVPGREDEKKD